MKKIFISSTYLDLKDERQAAIEIVDRNDHAVGMEKFFAEDHQLKMFASANFTNVRRSS